MFAKIFALFALVAVAMAAPSPNPAPSPKAAPEPAPQLLYTGLDYGYPAVAAAPVVSPYGAPVAYSAYSAYPAAYYVR